MFRVEGLETCRHIQCMDLDDVKITGGDLPVICVKYSPNDDLCVFDYILQHPI